MVSGRGRTPIKGTFVKGLPLWARGARPPKSSEILCRIVPRGLGSWNSYLLAAIPHWLPSPGAINSRALVGCHIHGQAFSSGQQLPSERNRYVG